MAGPRALDLFCGDGGAGEGYRRAGYSLTGVDITQHSYPPGEFIRADAMAVLRSPWYLDQFDLVHASPPCQASTTMSNRYRGAGGPTDDLVNLIPEVRELLEHWGGTYVIENVTGAKNDMPGAFKLSGGMFGLGVERPRLFLSSVPIQRPPYMRAVEPVGVYGRSHDGRRLWTRSNGTILRAAKSLSEGRAAMGIDWMEWADLTEAIPPAYTEWIGSQLIGVLDGAHAE